MALEWLDDVERSIRQAEQTLSELGSSLPPEDWVPERYGQYQGWPGLVDDPDETNSGDVHWHGVIVGRWQSAGLVREALDAAGKALRLCRAVRELRQALADVLRHITVDDHGLNCDIDCCAGKDVLRARDVLERWGRGGE